MRDFITWTDDLSVGIEALDEQHKSLVGLINRLHEAMSQQHGPAAVEQILGELAHHTRIHFAVEESLMRILNFPDYEAHYYLHLELNREIAELQRQSANGTRDIGFGLIHFLKMWLSKHIMEEDMQYSGFFQAASSEPTLGKRSWVRRLWASTPSG